MSIKQNKKCIKPPSSASSNEEVGQPYRCNADSKLHPRNRSKIPCSQDLESTLLNARHRKRLALSNSQVLSNRIALLKKEEERARKIMYEAKIRESKILKIREEQIRLAIEREMIVQKQTDDHKQVLIHQAQEEEVKRQKRIRQGKMVWRKKREDIENVRKVKEEIRKDIEEQQKIDNENKKKKHAFVREKELVQKNLKEKLKREKRKTNKKQYDKKLKEEESRIKQQQRELMKLEKTELQLIRRLKSTQMAQNRALDDLEQTIHCKPSTSWEEEDEQSEDKIESETLPVSKSGTSRNVQRMDSILEESMDSEN